MSKVVFHNNNQEKKLSVKKFAFLSTIGSSKKMLLSLKNLHINTKLHEKLR